MIRSLFARLTGEPRRGQALFNVAVGEARQPHWFLEGEMPDTLNGRFAVLATVIALIMVRLEREGVQGEQAGIGLTERLVESLDTEIREIGLGDPTLGKQVRKLVGAVSGRVDRWRTLVGSDGSWSGEVRRSLYLDGQAGTAAVTHSDHALRQLWKRLEDTSIEALVNGRIE